MKVEKRVRDFIAQHRLFSDEAQVLVALSGGADSVALLLVLLHLGYRCSAVHCNFHLRGTESERDELFVLELCRLLDVSCKVLHFNTQEYAAQHGLSIEMAARELRYREFERLRQESGSDVIAVAHHQDDAVETLLLNLIRGAGINGLTGIRAKNGYVVRPLLCITRDEIIGYLGCLGQVYVTDSSNLVDDYARNKVRLNLIPMMQQINPAAKKNILHAMEHLTQVATLYNTVIEEENKRIVEPVDDISSREVLSISIPALLAAEVPQAQLFELLHPYGFNSAQVADIFRSLSGESGRMFYTTDYMLLRDRIRLIVFRRVDNIIKAESFALPYEGTLALPDGTRLSVCRVIPNSTWCVPKEHHVCVFDAARFTLPLTLRHPREGERFRPFGMRGSKLLNDLYTDLKLDRMAKQQQWLLCHGNDIVWAVGLRTSELCRLHGDEKEVVVVSVEPRKS